MDKVIKKDGSTVQSVNRALKILNILKNNPGGLGVTELAEELDIAKSTSHRLLQSLLIERFVKLDNITRKYQLGLGLMELGNEVMNNLDVRNIAKSHLEKLINKLDETAHLGIYENGEIVYIDKIENSSIHQMYSQIGRRASIHCTGIGKAMLAFLPKKELEWIVLNKGLSSFTKNTITTSEQLEKEMAEIRTTGYSIDNQEHEIGIRCVAAPILNMNGEVVAGISVAGPEARMTDEKLELCAKEIKLHAELISKELGHIL